MDENPSGDIKTVLSERYQGTVLLIYFERANFYLELGGSSDHFSIGLTILLAKSVYHLQLRNA